MGINIQKYGQGKPLVFFHGFGFDSHIWHPLLAHLSADYQIFLVDLPGFGLSSMMDWDCFKKKLIQDIPGPFSLVAWSLGGLFATRLALEEPALVSHLINTNSSPYFLEEDDWPGVKVALFDRFHSRLLVAPEDTLKEFMSLNSKRKNITYSHKPTAEGLASGLNILKTWDFRACLHELTLPTAYLFGKLDPIVPFKAMHVMQHRYPLFHYSCLQKGAHLLFLSHPNWFVQFLREFTL